MEQGSAAGIEGAMNQSANSVGLRETRYREQEEFEFEHHLGAAAINTTRPHDAYLAYRPLDRIHACWRACRAALAGPGRLAP